MTKEEVLKYWMDKGDHNSNIEFCVKYTEEYMKKKWLPEFASILNNGHIMECFTTMFKEFNITTVYKEGSNEIIKAY